MVDVLRCLDLFPSQTDAESEEEHPCGPEVDREFSEFVDDEENDPDYVPVEARNRNTSYTAGRSVQPSVLNEQENGSSSDSEADETMNTMVGARGRTRVRMRTRGGARQARLTVTSRGGRGRRGQVEDLFQWELYHAEDIYHPSDWLPTFNPRRNGKPNSR